MTTRITPQCVTCVHYLPATDTAGAPPFPRCAVFPAGIPWPIWDNEADNQQPYDGDHGLRWEPAWTGAQFPERSVTGP